MHPSSEEATEDYFKKERVTMETGGQKIQKTRNSTQEGKGTSRMMGERHWAPYVEGNLSRWNMSEALREISLRK